jgi:hypothetical protein
MLLIALYFATKEIERREGRYDSNASRLLEEKFNIPLVVSHKVVCASCNDEIFYYKNSTSPRCASFMRDIKYLSRKLK